ncbi:MAG: OsmC family protein, partial [Sideroxydans sp.]
MKARIKWVDGMTFIGESESGHAVVMDASPEVGGRNLGPRPMEMLLLGTGGCSSIDVMMILKKSRQAVSDCYVEMSAERAETDPKVFTKIHMHFVVKGKDIKPEAVEKAVKLSAEKY